MQDTIQSEFVDSCAWSKLQTCRWIRRRIYSTEIENYQVKHTVRFPSWSCCFWISQGDICFISKLILSPAIHRLSIIDLAFLSQDHLAAYFHNVLLESLMPSLVLNHSYIAGNRVGVALITSEMKERLPFIRVKWYQKAVEHIIKRYRSPWQILRRWFR